MSKQNRYNLHWHCLIPISGFSIRLFHYKSYPVKKYNSNFQIMTILCHSGVLWAEELCYRYFPILQTFTIVHRLFSRWGHFVCPSWNFVSKSNLSEPLSIYPIDQITCFRSKSECFKLSPFLSFPRDGICSVNRLLVLQKMGLLVNKWWIKLVVSMLNLAST